MNHRTATVTEIVGETTYDSDTVIVHAETDHDHVATLYYPANELPEVGDKIEVWFEMGGWSTNDSPVYKSSKHYAAV